MTQVGIIQYIKKVGDYSAYVLLPAPIRELFGITDTTPLSLTVTDTSIVITPIQKDVEHE